MAWLMDGLVDGWLGCWMAWLMDGLVDGRLGPVMHACFYTSILRT